MTGVIVTRTEGPEPGLLKLCVGLSAYPCFTLVTLGSPPLDPGSWESHQDLSALQSAGIVFMRSFTA